jgi:hypothetical protein
VSSTSVTRTSKPAVFRCSTQAPQHPQEALLNTSIAGHDAAALAGRAAREARPARAERIILRFIGGSVPMVAVVEPNGDRIGAPAPASHAL